MAEFKLKTYTAPASTVLTTELNSLANGSFSSASAAIDNSSTNDLYDDLEILLDYEAGVAPTNNQAIEVYLAASVDGSNYADTSPPARNLLVGSFLVNNTIAQQRLALRAVPLPPGLFKYLV